MSLFADHLSVDKRTRAACGLLEGVAVVTERGQASSLNN
jgi:hypothetical protein